MLLRSLKRRWLPSLLGFACLVVLLELAAARFERPSRGAPDGASAHDALVALPDGRRLHLRCAGVGEPTVILDAGLGLDSSVWGRVQPKLASITRTCAYDRAGYGLSDPGPRPRDSLRRADDLVGLLDATVEKRPFVLVAHSAAVAQARLAVQRRRDAIAGLVLIDPGAELEALKAIGPVWGGAYEARQAGALACIRATAAGEMTPANAIYEECGSPPLDGPLASRERAAAVLSENEPDPFVLSASTMTRSLGDLPIVVLTAGNKFGADEGAAPGETPSLRRAWLEAGAIIAASSTHGEQRVIQDASHVIQFEQPQAVIDAITDVVERARSACNLETPCR